MTFVANLILEPSGIDGATRRAELPKAAIEAHR